MRPCSKSEPRDTHALGHAPLQRQSYAPLHPLVGGVSFPPQWVPFLLAMHMTLPLPSSAAAARAEAAAEAAELGEAAAGAMETKAKAAAAAAAAEDAKAEAAAATSEPVAAVELEPEAELGTVSGAGARAEEAGRRPTGRLYDHSLLFSSFALLSSMSLSPLLLLGLLLAGAVSAAPRPLLHGCRARNSKVSKVSRTCIGPSRRWLVLGWLALVSGFHVPEDKGEVAQIGADVNSLSSHDESTITSGVDGAHERRQLSSDDDCEWFQLACGSSCNGDCDNIYDCDSSCKCYERGVHVTSKACNGWELPGYYVTGSVSTCYSNGKPHAQSCSRVQCPAGTYSPYGMSCLQCWAGTYSEAGASSCSNCGPGKYSTSSGATHAGTCSNCAPGKYSTLSGAARSGYCFDCPRGTWRSEGGAIFCTPCEGCEAGTTRGG